MNTGFHSMLVLYIDPGTGSMLFAILIGIISAGIWLLRGVWVKLRFLLSGGKKTEETEDTLPYVIFAEDKRYWNVFKPICEEFNRRETPLVYYTASPDDPALSADLPYVHAEFIGKGNRAFAKLNFLKADILLATTPGLEVYQWKRSKRVKWYVHMLHGPNEVVGYKMFGVDYYDALMLSGEYQARDTRFLEKKRGLPEKEIELIGIPYMDEMVRRLEKANLEDPITPAKERVVLIAPTWGTSGIFSKYGDQIIEKLLKTDYHIIIRPHPQSFVSEKEMMDALMQKYPESDRIEWNRDNDNFNVLRRADIMISDFSGVVFDFCLVFDKPLIYADTEFDASPYDVWWLETPYWTLTALPRIGAKLTQATLEKLPALIEECITDPKYAKGREEVRNETWVHPGEGTQRAVDYLIRKHEELERGE